MIRFGGPAAELVGDLVDPIHHPGRRLAHKRALPTEPGNQVPGNMPELSGKILVDVQNVHI